MASRDGVERPLHGDPRLLQRAFHNLINNAVKYSGGKPVRVTADNHSVSIEDHGIGIPKRDVPHIFEPFYRASNTGTTVGHGVGLSLAKAILDKCHARLHVESVEGRSTRMIIYFRP